MLGVLPTHLFKLAALIITNKKVRVTMCVKQQNQDTKILISSSCTRLDSDAQIYRSCNILLFTWWQQQTLLTTLLLEGDPGTIIPIYKKKRGAHEEQGMCQGF